MHPIRTINRQMYNFNNRLITITARGVRGRGGRGCTKLGEAKSLIQQSLKHDP